MKRTFLIELIVAIPLLAYGVGHAERPYFEPASGTLKPTKSPYTCSSGKSIKEKLPKFTDSFWQGKGGDFLYLDDKTRTLAICYKSTFVAAQLDFLKETDTEGIVNPLFEDIDGDGTLEFTIFRGQCVEGPCLGKYLLYRVEKKEIKKLGVIRAEGVSSVIEKDRRGLLLNKYCFNYDFGVAYSYFGILEFPKDNGKEIKLLPPAEMKTHFPATLGAREDLNRKNAARTRASSPQNRVEVNQDKIQALIDSAYRGKPVDELIKAYNEIAAEGEKSLPGVHCAPLEIIRAIAGGKLPE